MSDPSENAPHKKHLDGGQPTQDEQAALPKSNQSEPPNDHMVKKTTHLELDEDLSSEDDLPRLGTAAVGLRTELVLSVRDGQQQFRFDSTELEQLVIGRYDPDTGNRPEVDLEAAQAMELGVSRRHAMIVRHNGMLHIQDLGSHNGTFLNGQKLVPRQPRILRNGDDLRLGYLVLEVNFARVPRR